MTKIINFSTRKVMQVEDLPQPVRAREPTHFNLENEPTFSSQAKILATREVNFREGWEVTVASYKSLGLKLTELEKHEVKLVEINKAVMTATVLKNDHEAADYFENLASRMADDGLFVIALKDITPIFRGYVWSLDFQVVMDANSLAAFESSSKIGRPLVRHIYF